MYCYTITLEKEEVLVMGSFDGWAQLHRLHRGNQWLLSVALPSRRQLEFRFLNRDGKWVVMPHYQHLMGPDGIANNFIEGAALINDNDDALLALLGYTHSDFVTIQDIPLCLVEQLLTITESISDWVTDSATSLQPPTALDRAEPIALSPITLRRPSVAATSTGTPFTPMTVDATSSIIPESTTLSYAFLSRVYNAPPSSTTSLPPPLLASPRTLDPKANATINLATLPFHSPNFRDYSTPLETEFSPKLKKYSTAESRPSPNGRRLSTLEPRKSPVMPPECVRTTTGGLLRTLTPGDRKLLVPSFKENYSMKEAFRTASHALFKEASQVKGHYYAGLLLPQRRSVHKGADVERTLSAPVAPPLPLQDLQKSATAPQPQPLPEPAESLTSAHEYSTPPLPPLSPPKFIPYCHQPQNNLRWSHAVEVVGGAGSTPPPAQKKAKTIALFFTLLFKGPTRDDEGSAILNQYRTKQAKLKKRQSTGDFTRVKSNPLLNKYRLQGQKPPQRPGADMNRVRLAPAPPLVVADKSPKRESRLFCLKDKLRNICKVPLRNKANGNANGSANGSANGFLNGSAFGPISAPKPVDEPLLPITRPPSYTTFKQPQKLDSFNPPERHHRRSRSRSRSRPRSRAERLREAAKPVMTYHDYLLSEESDEFLKTWTNRLAATAATTVTPVTRSVAGGSVPLPTGDKPLAVPYRGKIHIPELRLPMIPRPASPDLSVDDFRSVYTHFRDSRSKVNAVYGYGFDLNDLFVDAHALRSLFHLARPDPDFYSDYPLPSHMADLSSAAAVKSIYY